MILLSQRRCTAKIWYHVDQVNKAWVIRKTKVLVYHYEASVSSFINMIHDLQARWNNWCAKQWRRFWSGLLRNWQQKQLRSSKRYYSTKAIIRHFNGRMPTKALLRCKKISPLGLKIYPLILITTWKNFY